jgi:malic enzyme
LIGLSGIKGLFGQNVITEMSKINKHPIIFPLAAEK